MLKFEKILKRVLKNGLSILILDLFLFSCLLFIIQARWYIVIGYLLFRPFCYYLEKRLIVLDLVTYLLSQLETGSKNYFEERISHLEPEVRIVGLEKELEESKKE